MSTIGMIFGEIANPAPAPAEGTGESKPVDLYENLQLNTQNDWTIPLAYLTGLDRLHEHRGDAARRRLGGGCAQSGRGDLHDLARAWLRGWSCGQRRAFCGDVSSARLR